MNTDENYHNPNDPINEKMLQAVALSYDGSSSPTLSAKGTGQQAEEIIALAQENGVPLCDNAALVELLIRIELGESIPEELYLAVAHIIAFAYRLKAPTLTQSKPNYNDLKV